MAVYANTLWDKMCLYHTFGGLNARVGHTVDAWKTAYLSAIDTSGLVMSHATPRCRLD
jgi:hypothetical protein